MHQPAGARHGAPERLADALVPQAYAEYGDFSRKCHDYVFGDPRLAGRARSGRNYDPLRFQPARFIYGDAIVPVHHGLLAELSEALDEVIDERIVVVDYQYHDIKSQIPRP